MRKLAMQPRISLCIIAKNEERNLQGCLQSAAELVDEIIVVDTGSTDRTRDVAAGLGARVVDFPWVDDFAAARNESLRHATGEWIFWLDGDERLDDENRGRFRRLAESLNGQAAAFVMVQRSASKDAGNSATEVHQVRLFRNHPAVRWSYRVHEQILPGVRKAGHEVRFTDIAITHTGYVDSELRRRKTELNLRLLHLEDGDRPDDPFTLFNLGWAYQELGQVERALPLLRRSLEKCGPGDSIVRKLYALIAQGQRRLGQPREALAVCRAGRVRCPDDPELLFLEGALLQEEGDLIGAKACFQQLGHLQPGQHFASLDVGLRGCKARHHLALAAMSLGQDAEAEAAWRSLMAEHPDFGLAWLGLGELYLTRGRWGDLETLLERSPAESSWALEVSLLRARALLVRREYGEARRILDESIRRDPQAVGPRVLLTHALLQEGKDLGAAEQALRQVVELDPRQAESWRNLAILLAQQRRSGEALAACRSGRGHCPTDARLLLQEGLCLRDVGELTAAQRRLVQFLEIPPPPNGAGVEARHFQTVARHHLALIYQQQKRSADAEGHWRAVVAEEPDFLAGWLGLAEVYLEGRRGEELEAVIRRVEADPQGAVEAAVLRARERLAAREFVAARQLAEEAIARFPQSIWPRVVLSHVLLQENRDRDAAERALRDVLALDRTNAEARRNLALLLGQQERGEGNVGQASKLPEESEVSQVRSTGFSRLKPVLRTGDTTEDSAGWKPTPRFAVKCLRLAFACYSPLQFCIESAYQKPLGGSESALCYLAEALAARGHEVFLLNSEPEAGESRGVHCLPLANPVLEQLPALDAFVVLNCAGRARALRSVLSAKTRLVLWTGHAHDQPAIQALQDPTDRKAYDGFALVSEWQRQQFVRHFGLAPERTAVLRNGIAPAFCGLFPEGTSILAKKTWPPVLVYTSTPYRGLDLLLASFPRIREAVPSTTLQIFSSMKAYQIPETEEQARFGQLYEQCRTMEGVEYLGSVSQPDLAAQLRLAAVLAYPNTYPETSCIAVLEAMAAGCTVVTSDRAALPETTAGFGRLIPIGGDRETYLQRFVESSVEVLRQAAGPEREEVENRLRDQVTHVNQTSTWAALAEQWLEWLGHLRTGAGLL
jgi:tetratricopeptide (TPR) repeat protein/glycosyltransferase involved in cell wall biosynthesis